MTPTAQMRIIRSNARYVEASVHYNRRKFDKKFEIVARLRDDALEDLGVTIGGEIVLDVRDDRIEALESVKFFRNH
jgi:hypothetical protein